MTNMIMHITGTIIGYDPGGDKHHGLTRLVLKNGSIQEGTTETLDNSEQVIKVAQEQRSLIAVGVDTLTCWSTGKSGWRPADRWLLEKCKDNEIKNSIVSPNSLRGAMIFNGMALLVSLRNQRPELFITETHPKVLFWFLEREKYDYENKKNLMDKTLMKNLGIRISPSNNHEWDSAISAFAALQSVKGIWKHDLHEMPMAVEERLISPCGATHYFWPE
ncbi:MAG: hypothetical protein ACYSUY_02120 [Planctomycetota bacterium]|jgi:hypothetical protein